MWARLPEGKARARPGARGVAPRLGPASPVDSEAWRAHRWRGWGEMMGIKDWFAGDRKKAAFREKVREAVADGKLDSEDMKRLDELRRELDVTAAADDKTVMRRELYNQAVGAVRDRGALSATGVHDLARIQKFLALRDDQVERTKWDLQRLRTLTDIRKGNLPLVSSSNVALRGVQLEPDELAHYSLQVDVLDQPSTRQADGLLMMWGVNYEPGSAGAHVLPEAGARAIGEAAMILTNRRVILRTNGKTAAVRLSREAQIYLYSDGVRLARTVGNTLLKFRSKSEDTAEIVGELLAALMRCKKPGSEVVYRKMTRACARVAFR